MVDRTVNVRFKGRDESGQAFRSVQNNLRGLQSNIGQVTGVFSALTGVAAGLGLARVFNQAVEATQRYQQSTLRLDAVMKATGGSVGLTRQELEKFVLAMERDTVFAQNEIRDATSIMATFKSVQFDTFTQGIELAADMSAVMDQSLKASVVQLGKALEDPVRGLSAMREVGVSFTAQQEEMIEGMVEAGQQAEAQRVILEALEGQFGGTAGKMNQGVFGAVQSTGEAYDRFLVALGKTPAAKAAVEAPLASLTFMLNEMAEAIERGNRGIFDNPLLSPGGQLKQPLDLGGDREAFAEAETPGQEPPKMRPAPGEDIQAAHTAAAQERERQAAAAEAREEEAAEKRAEQWEEAGEIANKYYEAIAKRQEEVQKARKKQHEEDIKRAIERQRQSREEADATNAMIEEVVQMANEADQEAWERQARRTLAVLDEMNTERELLEKWREDRMNTIVEAGISELISWENVYEQRARITERYQEEITRIEDEEIKKRYGINQVYRKLDLESSQFFFGQMAQMMESGSRTMFEIGKASAIAETIIQTYRAAQGAYAALASIPFAGPALGAAAAAAAIVAGLARVQAIRSTQFGAASAASPVFSANPTTGQPTDFGPQTPPLFEPANQNQVFSQPRNVNVQIISDGGNVSEDWIRNKLIPGINEAVGDGVTVSSI